MIQADARHLPFRDKSFDMLFFSPPWDDLDIIMDAKSELIRVTKPKGRMVMLLPHLDNRELASMVVTNRDWTERQSLACPKPTGLTGKRYYSLDPGFVARVLMKFRPASVLDPFCGSGTVPRVAAQVGIRGVGCDLVR